MISEPILTNNTLYHHIIPRVYNNILNKVKSHEGHEESGNVSQENYDQGVGAEHTRRFNNEQVPTSHQQHHQDAGVTSDSQYPTDHHEYSNIRRANNQHGSENVHTSAYDNDAWDSNQQGKAYHQQNEPIIGSSNTAQNENVKSYSTTRNIGDPSLSAGSRGGMMDSSETTGKDKSMKRVSEKNQSEPGQAAHTEKHRRKSSFNKQAIMATLGLGAKSDADKSEQERETKRETEREVERAAHERAIERQSDLAEHEYHKGVPKHYGSSVRQKAEPANAMRTDRQHGLKSPSTERKNVQQERKLQGKAPQVSPNSRTHSEHTHAHQNVVDPNLKSTTSETHHDRPAKTAHPNYNSHADTLNEPLYSRDYALQQQDKNLKPSAVGSGHRDEELIAAEKFSAVDPTMTQASPGYMEQTNLQSSQAFVDPKQFDQDQFKMKNDEYREVDLSKELEEKNSPTQRGQDSHKGQRFETPASHQQSDTLDPKSKQADGAGSKSNTSDNGVWNSVMGAVGLGKRPSQTQNQNTGAGAENDYDLEQNLNDTHISDNRADSENKGHILASSSNKPGRTPTGARKNSIPPNIGDQHTHGDLMKKPAATSTDASDGRNIIPGSFVSGGNSKSMIDPTKKTYSSDNDSYTPTGPSKHIRNVSIGQTDAGAPQLQGHTADSSGISPHEEGYNYDANLGSVPRSARSDHREESTTDDNGNIITKITNTIQSSLQ